MAAIHSDEFKRDAVRIALTSGLTRRQVASDLGIGLSTLGKWVRAVSEEAKVPAQDAELLRETGGATGKPAARSRSPSSNTSTASITRAANTQPSAGNHPWPSNRGPPNMSI